MDATTIRSRRKELGWTQLDLAVRSQVAIKTIYRAERGERLTAANLAALDRALSAQESERAASPAKKNAAPEPAQKG